MSFISGRPSRSYAKVQHDPEGLSGVGNLPFGHDGRRSDERVKTYRPAAESLLRRGNAEEGVESSFPLHLHRRRKESAIAGQKAEIDHILDPEYKSTYGDADGNSIAGPSRANGVRTAGGFAATAGGAGDRKGKSVGMSVRSSSSIGSLRSQRSKLGGGGIYVDATGKRHDTEYDPFSKVSEMNRKLSRRRSAFGSDRRKGSDEDSSSGGSEVDGPNSAGLGSRNGDDQRQRVDSDARRQDSMAAVRRKSLLSDRGTLDGRRTPSIRSGDDADRFTVHSSVMDRKTKSAQGHYQRSPLSPNFSSTQMGSSYTTARTLATTEENRSEYSPEAPSTNSRLLSPPLGASAKLPNAPIREKEREKVEIRRDGSVKVTGFDAPTSPMPQPTPTFESAQNGTLKVPDGARSVASNRSANSRASSDRDRPKPVQRRREDTFPETPAQTKAREERAALSRGSAYARPSNSLAIDTRLASGSSRRPLPEIEIVDDDDPRVILPKDGQGRSTRIQQTQDHVIRGPFSLALNAQGGSGERRASSARSIPFSTGSGPSSLLDEAPNGYLPSRWASGDRLARVTEEERERYRPQEWGGKRGDLGGKPPEWTPDVKENIKRTMKDFSTSARISLFRAKKKLGRKADL